MEFTIIYTNDKLEAMYFFFKRNEISKQFNVIKQYVTLMTS